jgi:hypothetical protein
MNRILRPVLRASPVIAGSHDSDGLLAARSVDSSHRLFGIASDATAVLELEDYRDEKKFAGSPKTA